MPFWYPDEGTKNDPRWWSALLDVGRLTADREHLPIILPCEFMFMGAEDRRGKPRIWLYKHKWTRHHINLDDAGQAYRYVPPRDLDGRGRGRYVAHRSLTNAIALLELEIVSASWRREMIEGCDFCRELYPVPRIVPS